MYRALACLVLVVACSADAAREVTIDEHEVITKTVAIDATQGTLEIMLDGRPAARFPATVGSKAALPLEGRTCTAMVTKIGTYQTYVTIACADGPAPGSIAADPSSRSLLGVLIVLPLFGLGILSGIAVRYHERTKKQQGLAMLSIVGSLCAFAGIPALAFHNDFMFSYMALGAGLTAAGYLAATMHGNVNGMSPWATVALVVAIVGFALIVPRWSVAAPVGAFGIGALAWIGVGLAIDKWGHR